MLKIHKEWSTTNSFPVLSQYGALLDWVDDVDLRISMLAANINMLRRTAPFAYLFINGALNMPWFEHGICLNNIDAKYASTLTSLKLQNGVWFTDLDWEEETETVVVAILTNDILPFVHYLYEDKCSILCLPRAIPLELINQTTLLADSGRKVVTSLLTNGGCLVSAIDHVIFSVTTFDNSYSEYFRTNVENDISGN